MEKPTNQNFKGAEGNKSIERTKISEMSVGDCLLADAALFEQIPNSATLTDLKRIKSGEELPLLSPSYGTALAIHHYGGIELAIEEKATWEGTVAINATSIRDYWPMLDGQIFKKDERLPSGEIVEYPWVRAEYLIKLKFSEAAVAHKTETNGLPILEEFKRQRAERRRASRQNN